MFSSKQTFTINGNTNEALEKVLQFALELSDESIKSFYEDENGLVLCSSNYNNSIVYPFKATIPILVEQINQYLDNLSNEVIERLAGIVPDVDGIVELGWEVFHPLWYGKNEIKRYQLDAIIAIRPCWIIYSK